MIDAKCLTLVNVPLIKVEERGRKAVFRNPGNVSHEKIQMDGCVVKNDTAADWVICKPDVGTIIVELKGKHVEHGADQIQATADHLKKIGYSTGKLAGLIVSTGYPKASTGIQKKAQSFSKKHRGPLHVVTKNSQFEFDRVLSAEGPH
ncbi:hypothetical protein [Rhizobium leguminosarum]|uniref:hypothetical protein n=1 Tax=Rhizobium leguminosarum TaxID=384 RepID=UPI003F983C5A